MGKYILKRLLMLIPVIFGVVLIVFTILRLSPNDPIRTILGDMASEEEVEEMREEVGLNDSFVTQFVHYVGNIITKFDFGTSWTNGHKVLDEIKDRFVITVQIAVLSTLIAGLIGIPLGIMCALKQYGFVDNLCMVLALALLAIPEFWMALMLIIQFALKWKLLPPSGFYGVKYMILPILSEGLGCVAGILRTTRSNMLEVVRQDYIRTARAKGLSESVVIIKHALRNALIPVITLMGNQFGKMLGGVFVLETVFAIPGLGKLLVDACSLKNIPVVQGGVIFIAAIYGVINLLVDLIYGLVDPRIFGALKKSGGKKNG